MVDLPPGAAAGGLVVGGTVFALPGGARAVAPPALVRPVPGGPPELLGLALETGRAMLVWALDPTPAAWVSVESAGGPMMLGGAEASATAPPGAPGLVLPSLVAATAPGQRAPHLPAAPPASPLASSTGGHAAPAAALPRARTLALRHGAHAVTVPLEAMDGIRPMPTEISPVPGAPGCVLGYAETVDGVALLLDPAWCSAAAAPAAALPGLVAVLRQAGRRLGVPCARADPGKAGGALASRLSGTPDGRRALDLAPLVREATPPRQAEALRPLLLCRAAGLAFAVAAEEVAAVLQPQPPAPAPAGAGVPVRGLRAHRGEVLPIFDAAERLGARSVGTEAEAAPLLRLALPWPVALAVTQVLGLRSVAADALAPVAGDPLVVALAMLDGRPVPVCHAAALAGAPAP
jgi:chemotaxis signal transduction protein